MSERCTNCGDGYAPVEYRPAPFDPDEERFCSDSCEDAWNAAVEAEETVRASQYPAPLFGP